MTLRTIPDETVIAFIHLEVHYGCKTSWPLNTWKRELKLAKGVITEKKKLERNHILETLALGMKVNIKVKIVKKIKRHKRNE